MTMPINAGMDAFGNYGFMVIHLVRGAHGCGVLLDPLCSEPAISPTMFWLLMLGIVAMLAFAYCDESGSFMLACISLSVTTAEWFFILFEALMDVEFYLSLSAVKPKFSPAIF